MIGLVLCRVLVACTSLKAMTTVKLYQRIDYDCMSIYTQNLIWPAIRPHYLLNFGSKKQDHVRQNSPLLCMYYRFNNDKTSQR